MEREREGLMEKASRRYISDICPSASSFPLPSGLEVAALDRDPLLGGQRTSSVVRMLIT